MKYLPMLLLAACASSPAGAQTQDAAGATTASATAAATSAVQPEYRRKGGVVKPGQRPPASVVPAPKARVNTAQRMASTHSPPLLTALPNFTALDRDGRPVKSGSLPVSTHWLLIYRKQDCLPCDRLMNVLADAVSAGRRSGQPYVVVVGGKRPDALETVRANFAGLSGATWLADRNDEAYAALKPQGSPVVYAMDGHRIAWEVPGNLGDPTRVQKMTAAWIASGSAVASTTVAAAVSSAPSPASSAVTSTK